MLSEIDKDKFVDIFQENDCLGALFGVIINSLTEEECISEYQVLAEHHNPNGVLHGGALYSVMDSSQGAFLHFNLPDEFKAAATGTATIKYLAPVYEGVIQVKTRLTGQDGRKFFVQSKATNDSGVEVAVLDEVWIGLPDTNLR